MIYLSIIDNLLARFKNGDIGNLHCVITAGYALDISNEPTFLNTLRLSIAPDNNGLQWQFPPRVAVLSNAYKNGSNPDIDYAIKKIRAVNGYLCQATDEKFLLEEELGLLGQLFAD